MIALQEDKIMTKFPRPLKTTEIGHCEETENRNNGE